MAARFWVGGGSGLWSSTTNWSATTGGASGASVPGSADTATFDASSGAGTATVDSNVTIQTLSLSSFTGTLAFGTNTISVNSTGSVFSGGTGYAVTGTPVINVTSTGSTAISVSPNIATEANSISFNFTGGTYTLTFLSVSNYSARNVDFTGFAGTWLGGSVNRTIYGSLTLSTGMTVNSTTGILTFGATSGVQLITSNAKTYDGPITVNGVGGTVRLADALTLGSNRAVVLTNGTLDLNNNLLTCGAFTSVNSNVRTLAFGTGSITCLNSGTAWSTATITNLTITGTPAATIGYTGASTVIVSPGSLPEATAINFTFSAGTFPLTLSAGSVRNLTFTSGFQGSAAIGANTRTIYGNLTLSSAMTLTGGTSATTFAGTSGPYSITSNGKTIDGDINFSGVGGTWNLVDAFTLASPRVTTLTNGTLNLNNQTFTTGSFDASTTSARTIAFGTGNITCIGPASGSGWFWTSATVTNLTITGTPVVNVTYAGALAGSVSVGALSEASSISFNISAGTYTLTLLNVSGQTAKSINLAGFQGTWSSLGAVTLYGGLVLPSAPIALPSAGSITFGATSGTYTITGNGQTFDAPIIFNGSGGTWQLSDTFTLGTTRSVTHTNGTLNLNNNTLNVGASYTTATGTKNLTFNGGTLICPAASTTAFNNAASASFTTTAGTGTGKISMTAATAKTFVGAGSTFNCTLSNDGAGALTVSGSNTFTTIANGVSPTTFSFAAGTTTTVTNWSVSGTAGNLVTIQSATAASHTLSKTSGTVISDYLSISRSTATGGAVWYAGANSTDGGNNIGWIFLSPSGFYSITALSGSYALVGQNVGLYRSKLITASNGIYVLTGQTINITYSTGIAYTITATVGSYTLTGQSATLVKGLVLLSSYGVYAVTGQNATLTMGRLLLPQNGLYSLLGQAVNIRYSGEPIEAVTQYWIEIRSFTESRRI